MHRKSFCLMKIFLPTPMGSSPCNKYKLQARMQYKGEHTPDIRNRKPICVNAYAYNLCENASTWGASPRFNCSILFFRPPSLSPSLSIAFLLSFAFLPSHSLFASCRLYENGTPHGVCSTLVFPGGRYSIGLDSTFCPPQCAIVFG